MGSPTTQVNNDSGLPSAAKWLSSSSGKHEAERRKTLSRFSALSFRPVTPDADAELIQMCQEVAAYLDTPPVALYEITENRSKVLLTLLFCAPDMLLINFDFFQRLTPDEQKAMLAHELQHTRQPLHRVDLARRIGLNLKGFITAVAQLSQPLAKSMERMVLPFYRGCIAYIERQEAEADEAAITLTDVHTLTAVAAKGCAYILEKCYGRSVRADTSIIDLASQLNEALSLSQQYPMTMFTGHSPVERLRRLDAMAKTQAMTR